MKTRVLSFAMTAILAWGGATASAQTPLTLETMVTGLGNQVVDLQSAPGDRDRLFVVLQNGRIRVLELATKTMLTPAFLDITTKVGDNASERGLLGLAFHPQYDVNGYFFVNYTNNSGNTVVERYTVSAGNPNLADVSSASAVITIPQNANNHNGGQIQFGPNDGYLYIGMGDGGGSGDTGCRAQNDQLLLGKMLRLDIDTPPYVVPNDNPFVGSAPLDEIWATGLRNPWRFSFDRDNGDMYIGDVGQFFIEEVSYQPGTSLGGENYGWKIMEGNNCFGTGGCTSPAPCGSPVYTDPIHTYDHNAGACTIIGGYVYRGCQIQDLQGTYFFADHCNDRVWSFRYDGTTMTDFQERTSELDPGGALNAIATFGEDADGELYLGTLGGNIYRIIPNQTASWKDFGFGKVGGNGLEPELDLCGILDDGLFAELRLRHAPPGTFMLMFISDQLNPTPARGGTLAATPPVATVPLFADSNGEINGLITGDVDDTILYFQFLIFDPGATFNTSFSNTIWLEWP